MIENRRQWAALHKQPTFHHDRPRVADQPFRTCSRCEERLPSEQFRLDSRGYRRSHCIACQRLDTQEWRERKRAAL